MSKRMIRASWDIPSSVLNVTPKAGDEVMISEMVTRDALSWKPNARDRRFLTCRYRPRDNFAQEPFRDAIVGRLQPKTQELISQASTKHIKSIFETA